MMKKLREYLQEQINEQLKMAVLSGHKSKDGADKVKIRPVANQGHIFYQASSFQGSKVFHKNYEKQELINFVMQSL